MPLSEAEVVKNHNDMSSAHFTSGSFYMSNVNVNFHGGSKHNVEFRNNRKSDVIGEGSRKYLLPKRVSPGGPDGHHHFKIVDNTVSKRT